MCGVGATVVYDIVHQLEMRIDGAVDGKVVLLKDEAKSIVNERCRLRADVVGLRAVAGAVTPGDDLAALKAKRVPKTEFPDWTLEIGAGLV